MNELINWTLLFKKSSSALRTLLYGRKRSAEKVRNFKSTLTGLRIDTEYVIKISFVLSGRKLGSESYRILCNGGPCRKSSSDSRCEILVYFSSRSLKMRENYISCAKLVFTFQFYLSKIEKWHTSLKQHINLAKLIYFSLVLTKWAEKKTKYFAP